jgi:hypothetical protein
MPVDPVTVDTTILVAGEVIPSYGSILLIGENEGGSLTVNNVKKYNSIVDVVTDFLITSKVYKAAANLFAVGVTSFYAVKVLKTSVGSESINAGSAISFANGPVKGGTVVCATYTVQYDFTDPPVDPGANKASVGTEGTKIFLSGSGSKNVAYDWYDITALGNAVRDYERLVDIIYFVHYTQGTGGNGGFSSQDWGPFAKIEDLADTYAWIMPVCGRGDQLATVQATDLKCSTMTSFTSKNVITFAHRNVTTTEDMGAILAAKMALTVPWDKMMWKVMPNLTTANITQFSKSEVTTFETNNENALILKQGLWRISDGLSMAGAGSYKFIDVTRTRYYLEELIMWDLESLIADVPVPFTTEGILTVKSCIEKSCAKMVEMGALKQPFVQNGVRTNGFSVAMPKYDDISSADKAARILKNIYTTVYLTGRIESITLNLAISV